MRTQDQTKANSAEAFLISCMDFRLLDDIDRVMDRLGYNNNYDHFIAAGSSLGVVQDKFPHWGQACIDHMEIGAKLHNFKKVIIIDHEDCGAFKKFYPELVGNLELERQYHKEHIQKVYNKLSSRFPTMDFSAYLMNIEGNIKPVDLQKAEITRPETEEAIENQQH